MTSIKINIPLWLLDARFLWKSGKKFIFMNPFSLSYVPHSGSLSRSNTRSSPLFPTQVNLRASLPNRMLRHFERSMPQTHSPGHTIPLVGDLKGDPLDWMQCCFNAAYVDSASWGTCSLMWRLSISALDKAALDAFILPSRQGAQSRFQ
jgi:hypothetical protein